jgi:two-component system nitrate/nitrite response regulator NarL
VRPQITVVIADRYPIVVDALDTLFRSAEDFTVVARCSTAAEVRAAVAAHQPDVLVSDVWVNERDPLAFVRELRADRSPTRIVLYSGRLNDDLMLEAAYLRVEGVVPKTMPPRSLIACVRSVHAGERWLAPRVPVRPPEARPGQARPGTDPVASLTPRELEIAGLAARGRRSKDIARALDISPSTVRIHLHNVYVKLKLPGHVELTVFAREHGLLSAPDPVPAGALLGPRAPEPAHREADDAPCERDRGALSPAGGSRGGRAATRAPRRRGRA